MPMLPSMARAESNRATSMCWPVPVWVRACRAVSMPMVSCRPANKSTTATPTFWGWPSGSPVMLMRPDSPWMM